MATMATFFQSNAQAANTAQAHVAGPHFTGHDPFDLRPLPNDHIYLYSKRIDNSRMVRQANPDAGRESWSAAGAVAVLMMLGSSIIAPHVASVLAGYQLETLKTDRQAPIAPARGR